MYCRIPAISTSAIQQIDILLTNKNINQMADESIAAVLAFRSNGLPGENDVIMPSNITGDIMTWSVLLLPSEIGVLVISSSIDVEVTLDIKSE